MSYLKPVSDGLDRGKRFSYSAITALSLLIVACSQNEPEREGKWGREGSYPIFESYIYCPGEKISAEQAKDSMPVVFKGEVAEVKKEWPTSCKVTFKPQKFYRGADLLQKDKDNRIQLRVMHDPKDVRQNDNAEECKYRKGKDYLVYAKAPTKTKSDYGLEHLSCSFSQPISQAGDDIRILELRH